MVKRFGWSFLFVSHWDYLWMDDLFLTNLFFFESCEFSLRLFCTLPTWEAIEASVPEEDSPRWRGWGEVKFASWRWWKGGTFTLWYLNMGWIRKHWKKVRRITEEVWSKWMGISLISPQHLLAAEKNPVGNPSSESPDFQVFFFQGLANISMSKSLKCQPLD